MCTTGIMRSSQCLLFLRIFWHWHPRATASSSTAYTSFQIRIATFIFTETIHFVLRWFFAYTLRLTNITLLGLKRLKCIESSASGFKVYDSCLRTDCLMQKIIVLDMLMPLYLINVHRLTIRRPPNHSYQIL